MNLVVNARDAMPDGGRLRIETANVSCDARAAATQPRPRPVASVMLSVSDTGVGMTASARAHLRAVLHDERQRRRHRTRSSMVYGIVKQSGGWISISSEPGLGTTFTVYLPQAGPSGVRTRQGCGPRRSPGPRRSCSWKTKPACGAWRRPCFATAATGSSRPRTGEEALQAAPDFNGTIHLLLTDVVLPGMTGKELADRLLAERPGDESAFAAATPRTSSRTAA